MNTGWISLLTVARLDQIIVNHKFHEAQQTLEDILSGYRSGMNEDFNQRDLIAVENWAREKTEYSLDTTKTCQTDGPSLVTVMAKYSNTPRLFQK
jgi:hypothetical protein